MKLKLLLLAIITTLSISVNAQDWSLYEQTYITGQVSGSIGRGYLFKISGEYFEIIEGSRQRVKVRNPDVTIYKSGDTYKLVIEDFDEPVFCRKNKKVIESRIDGEFKGWEGSTLFKLSNGQVWQQTEYAYMYHYAYSPSVIIYESVNGIKLKVDDVDDIITVARLK